MRLLCVFLVCVAACMAQFTHGQAARAVIGQQWFTAAVDGASQTLIGAPSGLAYANNTLFVADSNRVSAAPINNRVLVYRNITSQFPEQSATPPNQGARCPVCGGLASTVVGQPNFTATDPAATQAGLSLPTAVATDGTILAVADTNNNRVLIWNSIPTSNGAPANVVVGQPDFTSTATSVPPTAKSLRGPQGVWIQDGKLYVADTQDHRVMIYNHIPASNGAAADVVLGQPNFTTYVEPDLTQQKSDATANNLLNPVSVTSDGVRVYVTDLGHNRVLIWNGLPTQNQQSADVVIGQPDMTSSLPNNTPAMCASTGKDSSGNPLYPALCDPTLSFPRYALSDGTVLFIADGGNDRVTVYKEVPTKNGAVPDVILGAPDGVTEHTGTGTDQLATPMSLAWDGGNLYVSDTFNRRVLIYSPAAILIPLTGVRNAASLEIFAVGSVTLGGTINATDVVTITIGGTDYTYTVAKNDTFDNVVNGLVKAINSSNSGKGDPNATAEPDTAAEAVVLTAKKSGSDGNNVTLAASVSANAKITATASDANLSGGQDAAQVSPGTLITIYGKDLSDTTASDPGTGTHLPTELANTQVFIDGNPVPLLFVSPTQINAQMPLFGADTGSVSLYVRAQHSDGSPATVSTAVPVTIVPENPGIFAQGGSDPRPGVVTHGSPVANGVVSVDGSINTGDVGTVKVNGRSYSYTVTASDTLTTVTTALANAIDKDPQVTAHPAGVFTRIILQARQPGAAGEGIPFSASVSSGAQLLLTAIGLTSGSNTVLCCANTGLVTSKNPAVPGETITVYATGLGLPSAADPGYKTGRRYDGPGAQPTSSVSSLAGGKTANVLLASPLPGSVGIWQVQLQLNSSLTTDSLTQLTIAQDLYVSNIVAFPVKAP